MSSSPADEDPALRALAHPTRLRMLSLMWSAAHSATSLATELGIAHGLASQHLSKLVQAELVELDEVRAKKGGRERLYRTVHDRHLSSRGDGTALIATAIATNLRHRAQHRAPGRGVSVDAEMRVAPRVWERFLTDLEALTDRLHAHAEPPSTPDTIPVATTIMAHRLRDE